MRVVSWLGTLALVVVIGAGAAVALRVHTESARALAASKPPAAAVFQGTFTADARSEHHLPRPSPDPSPSLVASAPQPAAVAAPSRPPAIVIGSTQQVLINRDRAASGLGPLGWSSCLYSVATANASRLSRQGWVPPYHTNGPSQDLGCGLGNNAGENVGYWSGGVNDPQLNSMFWASAEHRANILGPYRFVATAWVVAPNGYAYIAVEFS